MVHRLVLGKLCDWTLIGVLIQVAFCFSPSAMRPMSSTLRGPRPRWALMDACVAPGVFLAGPLRMSVKLPVGE